MFMPDPGSEFFQPGSREKKIPNFGSGSASKLSENMILDVHLGFRIQIFSIPDPGVKKAPDFGSGSATLSISVGKETSVYRQKAEKADLNS